MTQLLAESLANSEADVELRQTVHQYFGRWTHSMLTMFEITVSPGAWGKVGRLLIFEVSPLYSIIFVLYVWGVTFAIIRVISALFLKEVLEVAANDEENALEKRQKKDVKDLTNLRRIFRRADRDGAGSLTLKDMEKDRVSYSIPVLL